MNAKTLARFWRLVEKTDTCWLWAGGRNRQGYGRFQYDFRRLLAHRVAWSIATGYEPKLCVLHRCDNPGCVRPEHLFLGTRGDNNRDCRSKGRNALGESHGRAKLTPEQVNDIRLRYRAGNAPALAAEYGVCHQMVWLIATRKKWRHMPDPQK